MSMSNLEDPDLEAMEGGARVLPAKIKRSSSIRMFHAKGRQNIKEQSHRSPAVQGQHVQVRQLLGSASQGSSEGICPF